MAPQPMGMENGQHQIAGHDQLVGCRETQDRAPVLAPGSAQRLTT